MRLHKIVSLTIVAVGMVFSSILFAQESSEEYKEKDVIHLSPVVVTADRIGVPLDRVSSSVTLITAELIESQQFQTISDALRNVSGVDIVRSGSTGKITSLFLRGTNGNHTLVMLDGVLLNDPLNGGFDFSNLNTDNVKSIELVRGAQSTLYGSDAIGGILNILSKNGSSELKISLNAEAGKYGTFKESGNISGRNDLIKYSLSLSQFNTDGLFDNDDYSLTTSSLSVTLNLKQDTKLTLSNRYSNSEGGTPGQLIFTYDPNARTANSLKATSILLNQKVSSIWRHKLNISRSEGEIDFDNSYVEGDLYPFGADSSNLNSSISSVDWQHDLHLNQFFVLTAGISWEEREGERDSKFTDFHNLTNTRSLYLLNHFRPSDKFSLSIGGRSDDHSTFGRSTNYRFTSAYIISNSLNHETKLRGSIGTGFRTPSINELFWPSTIYEGIEYFIGNINLEPEESTSFDIAIDQSFNEKKFHLSVDYFKNTFDGLISLGFMGYENINKAETKGLEISAKAILNNFLSASGNYTYLETEDKSTGNPLLRRPKHSGGFSLNYSHTGALQLNFGITYVGERFDSDFAGFPFIYEFTPAYKTVRVASSYSLTEMVKLKLRIENLLDETYEEAAGFPSPGRAVYGGITLKL